MEYLNRRGSEPAFNDLTEPAVNDLPEDNPIHDDVHHQHE
jgi:hypothetical protein